MGRPRSPELSVDPRRLFDKALIGDGCWEWQGAKAKQGYGLLAIDYRNRLAHRLAYHAWYGIDPGDLFVCHHCDNPSCIRPDHLFLGTAADNTQDAVIKGRTRNGWKDRTTCVHGHPFDDENTAIYRSSRGGIGRGCRICRREACRRWRNRRQAA